MLSQLLSRFFGQQDPNKTINARLKQLWQPWLAPISADKPVGDDLTYHDSFQEIKEEIAKLSGVDYSLVMAESELILKNESKDIRVVTYYCLSKLYIDGADGFADGLEILAGLLDKFGANLYPSRQNIRKNAIEWLANAKFTDKLNQLQPIDEDTLSRIIAALNLIVQSCVKIFVTDNPSQMVSSPDLDGLIRFFVNSLKQQTVKQNSQTQSSGSSSKSSADTQTTTQHQHSSVEINSQRDLLEQARKMAHYLREKPEGYLAAGRFLRVLRWDTIAHLPPIIDNRGKTRLTAPRAELRQNINRLIQQQAWSELFEKAEGAFMEGANHFWLDLQRAAILSLQKMDDLYQSWAPIYLNDMRLMLDRLKGVEKLTFDNGIPFADDDTLQWIVTSVNVQKSSTDDSSSITLLADQDWNDIEQQALKLANSQSLEHAYLWMQTLPHINSPKQHYLLQYTQARIAEQVGQYEVALRLLVGLNQQQTTISLLDWESTLMFSIKGNLLKLLKQKIQLKESNKIQLTEQIEKLQYELTQLDPARSLSLV